MKVLRFAGTTLGVAVISAGVLVGVPGAANAEPLGCSSAEQGSTSTTGT